MRVMIWIVGVLAQDGFLAAGFGLIKRPSEFRVLRPDCHRGVRRLC